MTKRLVWMTLIALLALGGATLHARERAENKKRDKDRKEAREKDRDKGRDMDGNREKAQKTRSAKGVVKSFDAETGELTVECKVKGKIRELKVSVPAEAEIYYGKTRYDGAALAKGAEVQIHVECDEDGKATDTVAKVRLYKKPRAGAKGDGEGEKDGEGDGIRKKDRDRERDRDRKKDREDDRGDQRPKKVDGGDNSVED